MSKTKWGIRIQECEILYYYSAGKGNTLHKKVIFLSKKNVFYVIFFFSCLKMVFCELMLLELGDLLGLSLLRNFLVRQGQYFLVNISARWLNISILLI